MDAYKLFYEPTKFKANGKGVASYKTAEKKSSPIKILRQWHFDAELKRDSALLKRRDTFCLSQVMKLSVISLLAKYKDIAYKEVPSLVSKFVGITAWKANQL